MIYDKADAQRCLDSTKWLIEQHHTELDFLVADWKKALQVLGLEEDPDDLV